VIGIGGSSLGVKAIYEFLLPSNKYQKDLVFLETLDPLEINHCLTKFDIFDALFVLISKSGNTIETISLFKFLRTLVEINSDNFSVIFKA
jgi:glucose-6-phosphate isomerase